jgi:hypothetical protein
VREREKFLLYGTPRGHTRHWSLDRDWSLDRLEDEWGKKKEQGRVNSGHPLLKTFFEEVGSACPVDKAAEKTAVRLLLPRASRANAPSRRRATH